MYYIKNQSESPSVEKFKSTITYALREYRKMKNRELRVGKSNDDIWQAADLNINAIPSKIADDYKSFFSNIQKINYLKFKLFTKNGSDIPGSFFDNILDTKSAIVSENPVLNYPNPQNIDKVSELIALSDGYAETHMKVTDNTGDTKKYVNDDFQQQTTIECLDVDDYHEKSRDIVFKLSKNSTLSEISDGAKQEYERVKPRLLQYYKSIIKKITTGDK